MLLYLVTFHQHILYVDLHIVANLIFKDLINVALIGGASVL